MTVVGQRSYTFSITKFLPYPKIPWDGTLSRVWEIYFKPALSNRKGNETDRFFVYSHPHFKHFLRNRSFWWIFVLSKVGYYKKTTANISYSHTKSFFCLIREQLGFLLVIEERRCFARKNALRWRCFSHTINIVFNDLDTFTSINSVSSLNRQIYF